MNKFDTSILQETIKNLNPNARLIKNKAEELLKLIDTYNGKSVKRIKRCIELTDKLLKNEDVSNDYIQLANQISGHSSPSLQSIGTGMLLLAGALFVTALLMILITQPYAASIAVAGMVCAKTLLGISGGSLFIGGMSLFAGRRNGISKAMKELDTAIRPSSLDVYDDFYYRTNAGDGEMSPYPPFVH